MTDIPTGKHPPTAPDKGKVTTAQQSQSLRVDRYIHDVFRQLWIAVCLEIGESKEIFLDYYLRTCFHTLIELLARNKCTCVHCKHAAVNFALIQKKYVHHQVLEWPAYLGRRLGISLSMLLPSTCWIAACFGVLQESCYDDSASTSERTTAHQVVMEASSSEIWALFHPRPDLKLDEQASINVASAVRIAAFAEGYVRANPQRFRDGSVDCDGCCALVPTTIGNLQRALVLITDEVTRC